MADKLEVLIPQADIAATVQRLAQEIDRDYGDRPPILIGVLKGSFIFLADLVRQMQIPIQRIELIRLSSYGSGTVSSGTVTMQMDLPDALIRQQHIIVVEDIVDSGLSINTLFETLRRSEPASLALCALLDKPDRRKHPVTIDYQGLTVPDRFIVGYGIDFDENYRYLPDICALEVAQSG